MKRLNNLYYNNLNFKSLKNEYSEIKKNCHNQNKLFGFSNCLNSNIYNILNKLYKNNYIHHNTNIFLIKEKKYRIIMSEEISDKIVNKWVTNYLLKPALLPCLIYENVATQVGKGGKLAHKLINKYINSIGTNKRIYVLKYDISKYFYSIDHNILKKMIGTKIKDKNALKIINEIIDLTNRKYINNDITNLINNEKRRIFNKNISKLSKDNLVEELNKIPKYQNNVGISIGNVCSQIFAIFYLNDLDHYIKENLRCKHYLRYMDDLIVFSNNKLFLKECHKLIDTYIKKLNLNPNKKNKIFIVNNGVTLLGYTYRIENNKLIKKPCTIVKRKIFKKLKFLKKKNYSKYFLSLISYKGYFGKKFIRYIKEYQYLILNNTKLIILKIRNKYMCSDIKYQKYNSYSINKIVKLLNKKHINYILLKENRIIVNK